MGQPRGRLAHLSRSSLWRKPRQMLGHSLGTPKASPRLFSFGLWATDSNSALLIDSAAGGAEFVGGHSFSSSRRRVSPTMRS